MVMPALAAQASTCNLFLSLLFAQKLLPTQVSAREHIMSLLSLSKPSSKSSHFQNHQAGKHARTNAQAHGILPRHRVHVPAEACGARQHRVPPIQAQWVQVLRVRRAAYHAR